MSDQAQGTPGALTAKDIVDLTQRPSDAFNEVILQADYTTRASLSFYRFRQLGGDYRVRNEKFDDHKKRRAEKKKSGAPASELGQDSAELRDRVPALLDKP